MNNLIIKISLILKKYKIIYYILNLTWGLLLTIIGWIVAFVMLITFHKPKLKNVVLCFYVNSKMGFGFSIGMTIVASVDSVIPHEIGHTYQNAIFGIFMPFLISIPSMIRYWYYVIKVKKGITFSSDWYESIWFEHSASEIGKVVA